MTRDDYRNILVGIKKAAVKRSAVEMKKPLEKQFRHDVVKKYVSNASELWNAYAMIEAKCSDLYLNARIKDETFAQRVSKLEKEFDKLEGIYQQLELYEVVEKAEEVNRMLREVEGQQTLVVNQEEQTKLEQKKKGRGGARPNSGPKKQGINRKVSINLPENEWARIDALVKNGHVASVSDYFRKLHSLSMKGGEYDAMSES